MSLQLPEATPVAEETLRAIADRYGVRADHFTCLPDVGIFNTIYALGDDVILRVPRDHPHFIATARKEAIVVPVARAAGVRTPCVIAFDDTLELLAVPYTLYEWAQGETLGLLDLEPTETPQVWREVGHDLALLHTRVAPEGPIAAIEHQRLPDPRERVEEYARLGYFTASEARWLLRLLDRLAPAALAPIPKRLIHGDMQTTNLIVRHDATGFWGYVALLDWGSAGWDDPAYDFAGIPLRAVPGMLEGYRAVAPLDGDETAEARILWRHMQIALWLLRREPQPLRAWAERPLAMALEIVRFFAEAPDPRWAKFALADEEQTADNESDRLI